MSLAREIRYGNWVVFENGITKVNLKNYNDCCYFSSPAPINPIFLQKHFGFTKKNVPGCEPEYIRVCEHGELVWDENGLELIIEEAVSLSFPHIKHLHKLQNLWFELVGTEIDEK